MEERVVARFRASLVFAFLLAILGALGARLCCIQVVQHGAYGRASRVQRLEWAADPAPRGDILDAAGRVLATSRPFPSVAVDPTRLPDPAAAAVALAGALGVDAEALRARLGKAAAQGKRFAWVRRGVEDPGAMARLGALGLPADALEIRDEMRRCYPTGGVAAQVLGFVDVDGRGLEGIERARDAVLRGVDGRRAVLVDAKGRPIAIPDVSSTPAVRGRDVRLTLDAVVQGFAEDELRRTCEKNRPKGGVCLVLDPSDGAVLAMASWPTFDPADPGAAPPEARRARAITDSFEPGSTFKPLVAAAALQAGVVRADELIDCGEGWIRVGKRVVHEHEPRGYGRIRLAEVIARSSNCGMARVGLRLGIDRAFAALGELGLGRPTGIGLPGEVGGILRPRSEWTETYTLVSVSFGQEVAVTPLQLAAAYVPVAGDGRRVPPRILAAGARPAAEGPQAPPAPRVLDAAVAEEMRGMMAKVVTEGTARNLPRTGYTLAGKTGTAQKMKGGGEIAYVSSFVGMAPVARPRLLCLVLLDEPSKERGTPYGSSVAAPYAAEVLRKSLRYLGERPDAEAGERP